jgi:hypothetical protein
MSRVLSPPGFDRTSGWTGADGIYSIPLTGNETPGTARHTLFVFGDTFIGEVSPEGERMPGTVSALDGCPSEPIFDARRRKNRQVVLPAFELSKPVYTHHTHHTRGTP